MEMPRVEFPPWEKGYFIVLDNTRGDPPRKRGLYIYYLSVTQSQNG